ncbi:hypothetical protein [Acinetobacter bouvetii]|uniref:Uncharacterized protein n=1 Tax=Acinetobacter bouvetii TaxID=202951 RepID=A0A811G7N6_9GAMM|nr:hypothetical protein [Acinetobacter bouvetii]CAB1207516.1 hypothetical protein SFB21_0163 [Acinetobacter bouvetii]
MTHYAAIPQAQAIQQAPVLPFMLDTQANFNFAKNVKSASRIEKGQILVRDKRAPKCLDHEYLAFLGFLPWLHHHRITLAAFQLNPYWNEICDSVGFSHYSNLNYCLVNADAIHDQFKCKFLKRRIALEYSTFIEPISESIKTQKAVFKRCLDKHKQMNCIFVDLPCIFVHPAQVLSISDYELKLIKMARKWLERLHQSTELASKLYDVDWRIVKSLNGIYSVQALIYVIGNELKYSDFIVGEWKGACLANGYTNEVQHQPLDVHCYFAYNDMRSFWRKQIELFNEPLKIYRYESKSISYRWKTYTGNI